MPETSHSRLRVGIIGAGGIALSHMAALRASTEADLSTVCDAVASRAEQAARIEGCAWTTSVDELLADAEIDAVIVCTPNSTHEEIGRAVLASGKHLLMEKPLAMSVEGARALESAAREAGLALAVGHSHRFTDQSLAIQDALLAGVVGTPRFIRITINGGWIWPGWQAWVLNRAASGGHSLHNGVHLIDLACWWMGEEVISVYSRGQHVTSAALDIHDYLVTELGFASGAAAICEVSRGEVPRSSSLFEIVIVGTTGVLRREWDAEGILAWTDSGFQAWNPLGDDDGMFGRELASFVAATKDPACVTPPIADAVRAVELAVASEISLEHERTVTIGENA